MCLRCGTAYGGLCTVAGYWVCTCFLPGNNYRTSLRSSSWLLLIAVCAAKASAKPLGSSSEDDSDFTDPVGIGIFGAVGFGGPVSVFRLIENRTMFTLHSENNFAQFGRYSTKSRLNRGLVYSVIWSKIPSFSYIHKSNMVFSLNLKQMTPYDIGKHHYKLYRFTLYLNIV